MGTIELGNDWVQETSPEAVIYLPNYYWYDTNSGTNKYAWYIRPREDSGTVENAHYYRFFVELGDIDSEYADLNNTCLSWSGSSANCGADEETAGLNEITLLFDNSITPNPPRAVGGTAVFSCTDANTLALTKSLGWFGIGPGPGDLFLYNLTGGAIDLQGISSLK